MDKYSILDPTIAKLCRAHERYMMHEMQSEIERLESLSMSELEAELKKSDNYARRSLISKVMIFKSKEMRNGKNI